MGRKSTFPVVAVGDPLPDVTETGTLPDGVSFTSIGFGFATFSGTPAPGTEGSYSVALVATNADATVTQHFVLTVQA